MFDYIDFARYELRFLAGSTRHGALLRVLFADGLVGYADCHPWEAFGDHPLETQLTLLQKKQPTQLTQRSLYFARLDAEARHQGINLFAGLNIPESHYLIPDLKTCQFEHIEAALKDGYRCFKVKLGRRLADEAKQLKQLFSLTDRVRLDFNMSLDRMQLQTFLDSVKEDLNKIEFIEDPFPFDLVAWKEVQEAYRISLASDLNCSDANGHLESAKVLVFKPAIQDVVVGGTQKVVITSYLDHPFGQLCAAYCAAQAKIGICGLQSHMVYEQTPFSMLLGGNPRMQAPKGTGFGFDKLLEQTEWATGV